MHQKHPPAKVAVRNPSPRTSAWTKPLNPHAAITKTVSILCIGTARELKIRA